MSVTSHIPMPYQKLLYVHNCRHPVQYCFILLLAIVAAHQELDVGAQRLHDRVILADETGYGVLIIFGGSARICT